MTIHFIQVPVTLDAAAGEPDAPRTVTGVAVPWDTVATVSDGTKVSFSRGAFDLNAKAPKLLENHDMTALRGVVTELADSEEGLLFTATFAKTAAAQDAIELVKAGAYDSVSVGAVPTKFKYDKQGVMQVTSANLIEISLVAQPAYEAAQITEIAASSEANEIAASEPDADEPTIDTIPEETKVSENTPQVEAEAPASTPTEPIYAQARRAVKLPSPAEYILAMKRGGADFAQFNANIQAATGDVVVSDGSGLLPTQVVAPVFSDIDPLRPFVTALGARALPQAGSSFIRPYVKVHSAAGQQSTELTSLSTADFEVSDIPIDKKTFGGTLQLSEQIIDWSSPSILDAAISDMTGQYALATEKYAVDTMVAGTTGGNLLVTDLTDGEEIIADLYAAAADIASVGNYLPNACLVSPAAWAKLGAAVDGQGRPLFPLAGPVNSAGALPQGTSGWNGNILGLTLIVSNQVSDQAVGSKDADEYLWIMNTRAVEFYEQQKGFMELRNPATLGVQVSLRGYVACAVIDANMIRGLGPSPA